MGCCRQDTKKKVKKVKTYKRKGDPQYRTYTLSAKDTIEKLDTFTFGQVQDFLNFKQLCEANGITDKQIEEYIEVTHQVIQGKVERAEYDEKLGETIQTMNKIPACPKCHSPVHFERVNNMPCNKVGGKYKFMMYCQDWKYCGWEYYSRAGDVIEFLRRNRKVLNASLVTIEKIKEY